MTCACIDVNYVYAYAYAYACTVDVYAHIINTRHHSLTPSIYLSRCVVHSVSSADLSLVLSLAALYRRLHRAESALRLLGDVLNLPSSALDSNAQVCCM